MQDCYCRLAGTRARSAPYSTVQYVKSVSSGCGGFEAAEASNSCAAAFEAETLGAGGAMVGPSYGGGVAGRGRGTAAGLVTRYCAIPWRPIGWIRVFSPNRAEYTPEYRAIPQYRAIPRDGSYPTVSPPQSPSGLARRTSNGCCLEVSLPSLRFDVRRSCRPASASLPLPLPPLLSSSSSLLSLRSSISSRHQQLHLLPLLVRCPRLSARGSSPPPRPPSSTPCPPVGLAPVWSRTLPSLLCLSRPPLLARVSNTYICPLARGIWSAWAGVCVSLSLPRPR